MYNVSKLNLEKIPVSIKGIKKWAGFVLENGAKTPVSILDNKGVGINDTARLVDFETAKAAYLAGEFEAIGVSFYNEGITCIDNDCHNKENRARYEEITKDLLSKFDTYAETSISGLGTHIFVKGVKPEGYKHSDKYGVVEVYDDHFIIVTGNVIEGHDTYIANCQEELSTLCETHLIKKTDFKGLVGKGVYEKSDELILEKLQSIKKGKMFLEGKWDEVKKWDKESGTYIKAFPSHSEADFSFANLILYYNGNQPEQALRLIKNSKMWDAKRQAKKSSGYLEHTVAEASLRCSRVYDWDRKQTDIEDKIDFDEVMAIYNNNLLVKQAYENTLILTDNEDLNPYLCKYIVNYGSDNKEFISTMYGDLDSADNGKRFWLLNKNDLIYLSEGNEWLAWNGKVWDRCYDINLLAYAEKVFIHLKHEAYNLFRKSILAVSEKSTLEEQALELFEYASANKGKRQCLEMIEFSKAHFIDSQKEHKVLDKLNANLNVINLENGVYNLDDFSFHPHSREFYQTKITDTSYMENADCPLWCGMLEKVLPDTEIKNYLQKAIGYTLSSGYMEKSMFVLYGEKGNNGKTTISKTIHKLMGDYAVVAEKQTIMDIRANSAGSPRPDLLRLRDRRFVCISESEKDDKLAEGLIKNLTGGGMIICRTLHHEPVEFKALFKIFLDTNYKPQVRGTDQALWNRLKVIPFNHSIPQEDIDLNFGEKLEKELSGILNWCIEGYRLYKAVGLDMPEEMNKIISDYAEDMSSLDQWLKECITISPIAIGKGLTSKELYQSYKHWCTFNGEYAWTQRKFTQELNGKDGFKEVKKVQGYTKYINVALNDIGRLCFDRDKYTESDFARNYYEKVKEKFSPVNYKETDFYRLQQVEKIG